MRTSKLTKQMSTSCDGIGRDAEIKPAAFAERQMIEKGGDLPVRPRELKIRSCLSLANDLERCWKIGREQIGTMAIAAMWPVPSVAVVVEKHQQAARMGMAASHMLLEPLDQPDMK